MILDLKQFTCPSSAMDPTDQLLSHQTTNSPPASDIVSNKPVFSKLHLSTTASSLVWWFCFSTHFYTARSGDQTLLHQTNTEPGPPKAAKYAFFYSLILLLLCGLFCVISQPNARSSNTVLDVFVAPHTQVKVKPFGCFFTSQLINNYKANRKHDLSGW